MSENKRLVQETSFLSYEQIRASTMAGDKRMVFEAIREATVKNAPKTDYELSLQLGFDNPNKIRPRRRELVKDGLVEEAGKRICSISKKKAITWKTISTLNDNLFDEDGKDLVHLPVLESKKDWAWISRMMVQKGFKYMGMGAWKKK